MKIALFTLFGFLSFVIVCPMTMGWAMSMDMENMSGMSQMMQDNEDDDGAMPCEQCKKEKAEIVTSFGSQSQSTTPINTSVTFFAFWECAESLHVTNQKMPLLTNGPPLPTNILVGTLILHTEISTSLQQ
jgi:hypothetical protein